MKTVTNLEVLRNETRSLSVLRNSTSSNPMALEIIRNDVMLMRSDIIRALVDPNRDIDKECGYPSRILLEHYQHVWERDGVGARFINIFPDECWNDMPEVIEGEQREDTEFEEAFKQLTEDHDFFNLLHTADRVSGVGQYGVILLGVDDGKSLDQPLEGVTGLPLRGRTGGAAKRKLLYATPFGQVNIQTVAMEKDTRNPRFGQPLMYEIKWQEGNTMGDAEQWQSGIAKKVHWTRIIHIADNTVTSRTWGMPRLQRIFNYNFNKDKVLGGSSEMFWKGGFPGFSFELNPNVEGDIEFDAEAFRQQLDAWQNGMQRYLTLMNMSAKSLAVNIADPQPHWLMQIQAMCASEGIPMRVFLGTEEGQLAGSQDERAWDKRIKHRQNKYLSPKVVRPFTHRLIEAGILPWVDKFNTVWADISAPSDADKADIATKETQAITAYASGGAAALIPPEEYMLHVLKWQEKKVKAITAASKKFMDSSTMDRLSEVTGSGHPPPKPDNGVGGKKGKPTQTKTSRVRKATAPSSKRNKK